MARKIGMAAIVAALVGVSLAAVAQDNERGVTVLRGNNVTSEGVSMGIGGTSADTAPTNAANAINQTGNINAVRNGSANAGGEIGNAPPGGLPRTGRSSITVEARGTALVLSPHASERARGRVCGVPLRLASLDAPRARERSNHYYHRAYSESQNSRMRWRWA